MDPFSHLLLGYLLGFGIWGPGGLPYVVAAAVAGALPDGDILLYPLSHRFPLLRHRGISHSIFGVTVLAAVGCLLVPRAIGWGLGSGFASGSTLGFFLAMEVGGLSHVFLDSLDHWSVPIFAPFSPTEYKFDVDRIVNVGSMAFTVLAYAIMIYERGRVPMAWWVDTTELLLAAAVFYFAVRILARWRAGVAAREGGYSAVIPQAHPLHFAMFDEESTPELRRLRWARFHLTRGFDGPGRSLEVPLGVADPLPVGSPSAALSRTYGPSFAESWILGETRPFAEVRASPGGFDVFWYSLEMTFFGRSAGVLAHIDSATGKVTTRAMWRAPERVFGDPPIGSAPRASPAGPAV